MGRNAEYRPWYKNWKVWLVIILVIALIGGCNSKNKEAAGTVTGGTVTENQTTQTDPVQQEEPEQAMGAVGSTISYDGVSVTLNNVETMHDLSVLFSADPGKTYLICNITITNDSSRDFTYYAGAFKCVDSRLQKVDEDLMAGSQVDLYQTSIELLPGGSADAAIVFEVSEGGNCVLQWYNGLFSSKLLGEWSFTI